MDNLGSKIRVRYRYIYQLLSYGCSSSLMNF